MTKDIISSQGEMKSREKIFATYIIKGLKSQIVKVTLKISTTKEKLIEKWTKCTYNPMRTGHDP